MLFHDERRPFSLTVGQGHRAMPRKDIPMRKTQKRRLLPTLDMVRRGVPAEVRFIVDPVIRHRLAALGLRQGDHVTARARGWSGILIELAGGRQIIVGRRSAGCVLVAVQEPDQLINYGRMPRRAL